MLSYPKKLHHQQPQQDPFNQPFKLTLTEPGNLDTLTFTHARKSALPPGHIRVRVHNTGFNFKDLMHSLNMLSELRKHTQQQYELGHEFSGVVVEVAEGGNNNTSATVKVGDEVMGMLPNGGAFSSDVVCTHQQVVPKPSTLTFAQAGGVTVAYATAYYALVTVGQLKRDEVVLIHSAAGGVGQAAIKIARILLFLIVLMIKMTNKDMVGAKVIATAGSESKHKFLLDECKAACVADSHSPQSFAATVKTFTNNRGVDVILNSLSGEAIVLGI